MMITKMMITSTPMMVPIIPRFMGRTSSRDTGYPRNAGVNMRAFWWRLVLRVSSQAAPHLR
jgi:hypothetical protein